jgi:hypothetical protein
MGTPEYTPEEERARLSNLQKAYSQINSGGLNPILDVLSGIGSAIGNAPATQVKANAAWGAALFPDTYGSSNISANKPMDPSQYGSFMNTPGYNAGQAVPRGVVPEVQATEDPYLAALYSLMGTNTADTSGYDAALGTIAKQRKQTAKRYQTYTAQLSDLFGNLGRKSATYAQEQAGIGEASALTRSQVAAQQAQQAKRTRSADAKRLQAATEARAALGLGEAASGGAAGDIATLRAEQALTDQQAAGQTTIDTILANEALAKLMSSRQAGGFDLAGQQAQQQLNMSYEDALAALSGQEAQTKIQKSQAISAGAMSPSEQVAILQAAENYKNSLASQGTVVNPADKAGVWLEASPALKEVGYSLLQEFTPWYTETGGSLSMDPTKNATFSAALTAFKKAKPEAAALLDNNPALISLLQVYTGLK